MAHLEHPAGVGERGREHGAVSAVGRGHERPAAGDAGARARDHGRINVRHEIPAELLGYVYVVAAGHLVRVARDVDR